jgi:hypothetical protein
MYVIDVGTDTMSRPWTCSVLFPLVKHGAPEEIRTLNLLIRSAKFTQSGHDYLAFCMLWLPRRGHERHLKAGVNGQSNGQDP